MKIKLAEALLRRKELQAKVSQLQTIKAQNIYDLRVQRIKVSDGLDEVTANVPKLTASQVTEEYDYYARQLRLIDGLIQQANWTIDLDTEHNLTQDYADSKR